MCKHDGNLLDGNCVLGVCHCDHAIIGKYVIFIRNYFKKKPVDVTRPFEYINVREYRRGNQGWMDKIHTYKC